MRLKALALLAVIAFTAPRAAAAGDAAADGRPRKEKRVGHHRRARLDPQTTRLRAGSAGREARSPSTSVGHPNQGRLENGAHLDVSKPYFRVVPTYATGDVRWGLPGLTNALDRAARAVNKRWPGFALDVGDLSRKGGGDVLRHHSHESGRDADVGFYVADAKGKQVRARTFIRFDADFKSPTVPGARFDEAKNWYFVQHLLTDPSAHVSHIFIAAPLRQRLLSYARTHGVSRRLLDRAQMTMMQPTNSLPHDDHFHVRISCPSTQRGTCIEIAKNAPHGRSRLAQRGRKGRGKAVLRTPSGSDGRAVASRGRPTFRAPPLGRSAPVQEDATASVSDASKEGVSTFP